MGSLRLFINGLAVCHLDTNDKSWKVFFPNIDHHDFKVIIRKISNSGSDDERIQISQYFVPKSSNIAVTTKGSGFNTTGEFAETVNFSSLIGTGSQNLNLDDLETDDNLYAARAVLSGFKLNPVYLKVSFQPTFGIMRMNKLNKYQIFEEGNTTPTGTLKVKNSLESDEIKTRAGEVTTIDLGDGIVENLQHADNINYEIMLYNNCNEYPHICGADERSDFFHYYNIFKRTRTKKVELIAIPSTFLGDRVGCDTGVLS